MSTMLAVIMVLSVLFTAIAPANQVFAASEDPVTVALRVEGPQGLIQEESATGSTALEVLQSKFLPDNLIVTSSQYGRYVSSINGIQEAQYGQYSGWNFAIKRQGQWIIPDVGIDQYRLESNDQVLVYYGDLNTQLLKSISISSTPVNADTPFSVTVTKTTYDWVNTGFIDSPANGIKVKVGAVDAITNASGVAVFDHGVAAGNYSVEATDYRSGAAPGVVRGTQPLIVETKPEPAPIGHVTLSVEKFTIGQGYYKEPVIVPFFNGDNGASLLTRELGAGNYQNAGEINNSFYLTKVKDNKTAIQVPSFIQDQITTNGDQIGAKNDANWLGEFDYTSMSGWMYAVNNVLPDVGLSQYIPHEGDVIRTQFSLYGWGADLGANEWSYLPNPADKDALVARVAKINSDPNKSTVLADTAVRLAYEHAYTVLTNLESTQASVNSALVNLNKSFEDTEKPGITVTGISNNQEVTQANLGFNVVVTDNRPEAIVSVVKLNGTVITKLNETYSVVLVPGTNTITISATDAAGNIAEKSIVVIYKASMATTAKNHLNKTLAYMLRTITSPGYGTGNGEWSILSLARANYTVPEEYYQSYYTKVVTEVDRRMTLNNGLLDKVNGTENSRVILGLTSIGKDISRVGNYDLRSALSDYDYVIKQGINGPTFALLAFDSRNYVIPNAGAGKTQTTRENLVSYIVGKEVKKGTIDAGGWGFSLTSADVDLTSMALQALAPYYQSQPDVKSAGDRAIAWLSKKQDSEGGFGSSSESIAQVITALTALGIDPSTDARFIKNGKSAMDAILTFAATDGGFKHTRTGGVNGLATDQGAYALVAYDRFVIGSKRLYDMTDVTVEDTVKPVMTVTGVSDNQEVTQPELSLGVEVTDNSSTSVTKVVKLNGTIISEENGSYHLILLEGTNTINITATDESGNIAERDITVIYSKPDLNQVLNKNLAYILKTVTNPTFETSGGEWSVLSLARAKYEVPEGYYQGYYNNVVNKVKELMNVNKGVLDTIKGTEHSRAILGLTSIGKDPRNVGGYDLTSALANYDYVIKQGINGPIYALLAFDSHNYAIPTVQAEKKQATRDNLIAHIVGKEVNKGTIDAGGWSLGTPRPDVDLTAMALQALAPYYQTHPDVKSAGDRAVAWLAKTQDEYGGFGTSSESIAQVVTALSILGINPNTDERFIKNGKSALHALLSFAVADGGFQHVKSGPGSGVDSMATDQGTYALVAYDRFVNSHKSLYDMTDVTLETAPLPGGNEILLPDGDTPIIQIPSDNKDYTVAVTTADTNKEITIKIPEDNNAKIQVKLPSNSSLPQIEAVKGNVSLAIPKGAQITSGDSSAIELITFIDTTTSSLINKVNTIITNGKKLDSVNQAITLGGNNRIEFDQFITLTFKDKKGKQAAYIQNGSIHVIQSYASDAEGLAGGNLEYAYDNGNDLIVKTKHFTDFITYTSSVVQSPGGGVPPTSNRVTLSVDKLTIDKGYVIPKSSVDLQSGDSVWSVLKRELDKLGIPYELGAEKYDSVYVASIDGDGEFDHGSGSGWMYNVNGTYPQVGASKIFPKSGDSIEWRYTKDLGEDLGVKPPTGALPIGTTNDKKPIIDIPSDIKADYPVNITKDMKDKELITINIPNVTSKVILNLEEVKDSIPMISAVKGDISFSIDKGTVLKSGNANIELITALNTNDTTLQDLMKKGLSEEITKQLKLGQAFAMGNAKESVLFDRPVTLVLKGAKGQQVGFIEGDTFTPIEVYTTEAEGIEATKGKEKITYAFVKDNDLIIKTNHFTSFVSYTSTEKAPEAFDLTKVYSDANTISPWAVDAISEATEKALVEGSDGKFSPQTTVTRAEFTKMLVGVLGLDVQLAKAINFNDVTQGDWFYPFVNAAYKAGFIAGTSSDQFSPNEKLTREQMAVIMVNALKLSATEQTPMIDDLEQVSAWAKSAVQTIISQELMSGWDNQFHPSDEVTREMATVVAMRAYDSINNTK
ncbi:DUF4430 domain-containing protein [Paenibacillus qinlingensis]|nr:DUF4430 domain-containing protein [Paenibacillus qinlingensis]